MIVGQDTDSEATPFNAGMGWAVKLDKEQAFLGRWALGNRKDADARRPRWSVRRSPAAR